MQLSVQFVSEADLESIASNQGPQAGGLPISDKLANIEYIESIWPGLEDHIKEGGYSVDNEIEVFTESSGDLWLNLIGKEPRIFSANFAEFLASRLAELDPEHKLAVRVTFDLNDWESKLLPDYIIIGQSVYVGDPWRDINGDESRRTGVSMTCFTPEECLKLWHSQNHK